MPLQHLSQRDRGAWIGLTFAGVGVGIILSSLWTMLGLALGLDWRGLWVIAGVIAMLLSAITIRMLQPEPPVHADQQAGRNGLIGFSCLAAGYTCAGFGYIVTMTFLAAIVHTLPGLADLATASWLLVGIAAVPSVLFWSWPPPF